MEILLLAIVVLFVVLYRSNNKKELWKFLDRTKSQALKKYEPYSYKSIKKKVRELGQNYSVKEYLIQILAIGGGSFIIAILYFYNIIIAIIYAVIAIFFVPYISYLRNKRIFSEFVFEQVQVYTTNTIMEYETTRSFVKALEGVYSSGVLENPLKRDVKHMIELAYKNGSIDESINYMNEKYPYYIVKNMHQLFLQVTKEGAKNADEALENMLMDIDALVEAVYRDRIDRAAFYRRFLLFGVTIYLLIVIVQWVLQGDYYELIKLWWVQVVLHLIVSINSYFIIDGVKYYNENVGEE